MIGLVDLDEFSEKLQTASEPLSVKRDLLSSFLYFTKNFSHCKGNNKCPSSSFIMLSLDFSNCSFHHVHMEGRTGCPLALDMTEKLRNLNSLVFQVQKLYQIVVVVNMK